MSLDLVDLDSADELYVIANTPAFLLSKLRSNAAVGKLSRAVTSERLMSELKSSLDVQGDSVRERVYPLILVTALLLKNDRRSLLAARALPTNLRWYDDLIGLALNDVKPTSVTSFTLERGVVQQNQGRSTSNSNRVLVSDGAAS